MNVILATIFSIFAISGMGWAARKLLRIPLCPICLGVGGTWLWMLIARALGHAVDTTMLALLLGGSVAGIAYQLEKRLPQGRSPLLWKMLFIPAGFAAAYALARAQWPLFAAGAALALLTAFFLLPPGASRRQSETVEELKKKMQQCC